MIDKTQFQDNTPTERKLFSVETNEKIAEVLNSLVQINNDRIEGYGNATNETDEADLKLLFNGMAAKSKLFINQLANEVRKYGGTPTESTTTSGKAFRVWMDFKAILTGKDRKAILSSCEFGEDAAQDTYANAIKNGRELELPSDIMKMITDQKAQLSEDHNRVKALRDK